MSQDDMLLLGLAGLLLLALVVVTLLASRHAARQATLLERLEAEIRPFQVEWNQQRAKRDRLRNEMAAARRQTQESTQQLRQWQTTLKDLDARPAERVYLLNHHSRPDFALFMAPVLSEPGFSGNGEPETRLFAGTAPDEGSFRDMLLRRFPRANGYQVGAVRPFGIRAGADTGVT